jgi:hypothetical protein
VYNILGYSIEDIFSIRIYSRRYFVAPKKQERSFSGVPIARRAVDGAGQRDPEPLRPVEHL